MIHDAVSVACILILYVLSYRFGKIKTKTQLVLSSCFQWYSSKVDIILSSATVHRCSRIQNNSSAYIWFLWDTEEAILGNGSQNKSLDLSNANNLHVNTKNLKLIVSIHLSTVRFFTQLCFTFIFLLI